LPSKPSLECCHILQTPHPKPKLDTRTGHETAHVPLTNRQAKFCLSAMQAARRARICLSAMQAARHGTNLSVCRAGGKACASATPSPQPWTHPSTVLSVCRTDGKACASGMPSPPSWIRPSTVLSVCHTGGKACASATPSPPSWTRPSRASLETASISGCCQRSSGRRMSQRCESRRTNRRPPLDAAQDEGPASLHWSRGSTLSCFGQSLCGQCSLLN
jgi:hypothetical protein